METVARAVTVYLVLLVLFRATGKRSLAQVTTFDLVLVLIISEATQQALLGDDFSLTTAVLVMASLVGADRLLDWLQFRFDLVDRLVQGEPLLLVENGRPLPEGMARANVREAEVLQAARESQGLERMEQIRFAVLERSGQISVVPR